ncbi:MAG: hypothetical protein V3U59_05630 [Gammaproteobacteria bacterium]
MRSPIHWHAGASTLVCLLFLTTGFAAPGLSTEQWREDLAFAQEQMPEKHANLFHRLDPAEFDAAFDALNSELDGLEEHQIVVRLAQIVVSVGDGHSRLTLPFESGAGFFRGHTGTADANIESFRYFPLRLQRVSDGFVVVQTDSGNSQLLWSRLMAIDGRPIDAITAAIEPVVQRDNQNQVDHLMQRFIVVPEILHARGVIDDMESSEWTFVTREGMTETVDLEPVPLGTDVNWQRIRPGELPLYQRNSDLNYWFEFLPESKTVYFHYAEVVEHDGENISEFAERLFAFIDENDVDHMVIDLRGNVGGNNSLNKPLIRGVVRAKKLWEPGSLFVITDGGTFSAAMNYATALEQLTPAVFVGEGTGASPNSYGDSRKLVLPNSGLTIRLSSLYWQDSSPQDPRDSIEPLIPAQPTAEDHLSGRDPAMVEIERLIASSGSPAGNWTGTVAFPYMRVPLMLQIEQSPQTQGKMMIPALGVESAPLVDVLVQGSRATAEAQLETRGAPLAFRAAGDTLIGWVEYQGMPYPAVLQRNEPR